jgi:hypothetical protein
MVDSANLERVLTLMGDCSRTLYRIFFKTLVIVRCVYFAQYFAKLRENIINSQPADKQPAMAQCFATLMDAIDRTLLTKNRDRYASEMQ